MDNKFVANYDANGYAQAALQSGLDSVDVAFYRCAIKAGRAVTPALDAEKFVLLLFDGRPGYITVGDKLYNIDVPSAFAPDFDRSPYTIHAVEDLEYVMCVFGMNEWDKNFYKGWNLHLPYFSVYSDGVRFDHGERSASLASYSLIQPFQIGHVSLNVIRGVGGKVESAGHPLQHQWIYAVGGSRFDLAVGDKASAAQTKGDFALIPVNAAHKLSAGEGDEMFCFCIEFFADDDLQKYYLAQIFNGRMTETK